jgi:hypothetical protein
MLERKADLDAEWSALRARLEAVLDEGVTAVNAEVRRLGLEGILVP